MVVCSLLYSGIATLSDYQDKPVPSSGEDAQQFYAGGSEHSGQMIEGPPRKKQTPDSIAKEVFEAAKKLVVFIMECEVEWVWQVWRCECGGGGEGEKEGELRCLPGGRV